MIYGGLVVVIAYTSGSGGGEAEDYLITQSNMDILTQTSDRIEVQE